MHTASQHEVCVVDPVAAGFGDHGISYADALRIRNHNKVIL